MKKLSILLVLVVCLPVLSGKVFATGLKTGFSECEIVEMEDLHLGKNVQKVWTLRYSDQESPVTVVKHKTAAGVEYAVHSSYFEVVYAATPAGFGAKAARKSLCSVPAKINKAVLSEQELARQRVITQGKVDDNKALGLIASYLPDLINEGYTHLLN